MDEFYNLNWSRRYHRSDAENSRFHSTTFSDDENDIFYCHLNEIDPIFNKDDEKDFSKNHNYLPVDPRTRKIVENTIMDCTKKCNTKSKVTLFQNFPTKSEMNEAEHTACIRAISKMRKNASKWTESDRRDQEMFFALNQVRTNEKELFLGYVKNYFMSHSIQRCQTVKKKELENIVIDKWKRKLNRIKLRNKWCYQLQTALPLSIETADVSVKLKHENILKQSGTLPRIIFPSMKALTVEINVALEEIQQFYSLDQTDTCSAELASINDEANLMEECYADVLLPSSAINLFIDSPNNNNGFWSIPFTVQEITNADQETKNVIIFGKPFPPQHLPILEINQKAFEYSLKTLIIHPQNKSTMLLDAMKTLGDLEEIIGGNIKLTQSSELSNNIKEEKAIDKYFDLDDDEEKLYIADDEFLKDETKINNVATVVDEPIIEESISNKTAEEKNTMTSMADESTPHELIYNLQKMDKYLKSIKISSKTTKQETKCEKAKCKNVSYSLFKVTEKSESLNILIKTSQDGVVRDDNGHLQPVNLSTKIEYQTEFGAEVMTQSELIKEWSRNFPLPDTITKRVRIDSQTAILLSITNLTRENIESDLNRLYKITPEMMLQRLWEILKIIRNFPPGDYLCHHEPKNKDRVMIYVNCPSDNPNSLNIKKMYENLNLTNDGKLSLEVNWLQIDDLEITQIHRIAGVMPCAFPPWGKRKKLLINDKPKIVKRYNQKIEEKKQKIKMVQKLKQAKRKETKKRIKAQKLKKQKELLKSNNVIGETIDPSFVFDDKGNVKIDCYESDGKTKSMNSEMRNVNAKIDIERYVKEARVDDKL